MTTQITTQSNESAQTVLDAVIVGAGLSGLQMLYFLREAGFEVRVIEAAAGVGGTWYWNRYPGARVDSESYSYGYFFSRELLEEWDWDEHFSGQRKNERYLNRVADKFDLRRHIALRTRVVAAHFDSEENAWAIELSDGTRARARFLITAVGILSVPQYPQVPGRDRFEGLSLHTALWPTEPVDLKGKRVAVIGTGSSGVQVITAIAKDVAELTVFQRTPNWCTPLNNSRLTAADMADIKGRYDEIFTATQSMSGFVHSFVPSSAFDHTPEERRAVYGKVLEQRGFSSMYGNYTEVLTSKDINNEFCEYLAERIRERVQDPVTAERLIPKDHGYGGKRPPFESGYYEVYNQPNVRLVDVTETPLEEVTRSGILTAEAEHEFDVIVYATGFDAVTGAFAQIDIRGTREKSLGEFWGGCALTHLGLSTSGFPNLLFVGGPQCLAGNIPRVVDKQAAFITSLLEHMRAGGFARIESTELAEKAWYDHIEQVVNATVLGAGQWWAFGSNTPGKPRAFALYPGGVVQYGQFLDDCAAAGYSGFTIS